MEFGKAPTSTPAFGDFIPRWEGGRVEVFLEDGMGIRKGRDRWGGVMLSHEP